MNEPESTPESLDELARLQPCRSNLTFLVDAAATGCTIESAGGVHRSGRTS
jgi:hypothetical protein